MKIYRYFAKAVAYVATPQMMREDFTTGERVPIECIGYSNESVQAALVDAQARAQRMSERLAQGGSFDYLYEDRPVREEIVREFEHDGKLTAALTRNSQGAVVLNAARVFFADIDYQQEGPSLRGLIGGLFGKKQPSQDEQVIARIEQVVANDRSLGVRVYRTHNGFRCLATSRTFDPMSDESETLLNAFDSDPRYVKLCRIQECYRARVSPKPWRCDIGDPPAKFPFGSEVAEKRYRDWQTRYEQAAKQFATCAVIGNFGSSNVHPEAELVMQLHDHLACDGDGPLR